jgi:hypothetical protein
MAKNVCDDGNSYARASFRLSTAVFAKAEVRANPARPRSDYAYQASPSGQPLLNLNNLAGM